jgi:nitrate/nitrite transport system substrate-binding protein
METARKVFLPEVYERAAEELIVEGKMSTEDFPDFATEDGLRPLDHTTFIDGIPFDPRTPNAYLSHFAIGRDGAR